MSMHRGFRATFFRRGFSAVVVLVALLAWSWPAAADWIRAVWPQPDQGAAFVAPKSLTVTLDDDYAPYSFRADDGAPQGIMRDLWDLWSQKTGVAVRYESVDWIHRLDVLDSNEADVTGYILGTGQRLSRYLFSPAPVEDVEIVIFFDHDISGIAGAKSLEGFTVGVVSNGSCAEWLHQHGVTLTRTYSSWDSLYAAAARGEVNVFCGGKVPGIRRLYRTHMESLFRTSPPLYTSTISWAVRKDQPALRDFIARGFDMISPEERKAIELRWTGQPLDGWSRADLTLLLWGLLAAAFGAALLFLWNASLRGQVAAKTRSLAASEQRYRALVEAVPVAIFETDAEGGNAFVNQVWFEMSGLTREQSTGAGWIAGVHPEDRAGLIATWQRSVTARAKFRHEYRLARADGVVRWVLAEALPRFDAAGAFSGHIGSITDETEQRRLEAERLRLERQSEESKKLEALGQFAGGIAHDFNNFLGAILGYAQFIVEDAPEHPATRYAQRILTAGRRGRALVEQILTFTRRSRMRRSRFHLAELLPELEELLFASAAGTVDFRCHNADPDAVVDADRSQLGQVLLNLCINAQDALRGRPGTVAISIRPTELPVAVRAMLDSADGAAANGAVRVWTAVDGSAWAVAGRRDPSLPYVSLVVADIGPGMEATLLEQAFTPFFTTKERGHGTGLGLAVVKGVVAAHAVSPGGAVLAVHSRPGEGTEIEVALPRLAAPAIALPLGRIAPQPAPARAKRRVLLVDDDADFSDMMSLLLQRLGFEAVPYIRAREALADFRELPSTWDALISDQNMPEMSGLELVRAARALRPDFPCLICSAYSETLTDAAIREAGALALIRKPVDRDLLLNTLERALGNSEFATDPARAAADPSI